jgi:PAT family beta-lactamase induction signal transducer AmpG
MSDASWRAYLNPAVRRMLPLGFCAALPWVLIYGTLSFRLREAGITLATIGMMSWIALIYPCKWMWSPFLDQWRLPWLYVWFGQRRSWLLLAQCLAAGGLWFMASTDARTHLGLLMIATLLTAVAGATQDIALDAYRIESTSAECQGAAAAVYQTGYRLGMIWAGAGALWLAARASTGAALDYDPAGWAFAYRAMAISMATGMAAVLLTSDCRSGLTGKPLAPADDAVTAAAGQMIGSSAPLDWLAPLRDFASRYGWHAILLLLFVSSYRFPSIFMGIMSNPFYHDLGFAKQEVAAVSKIYGVVMALGGGFLGGALLVRVGLRRLLWVAPVCSSLAILLYVMLAQKGADLRFLILAVSIDNFTEGIAGTVFIAYLSGLANRRFTAAQYAMLSSATVLLPKVAGGFSGTLVEHVGYPAFFVSSAALGIVTLLLLWAVQRWLPQTLTGHVP